MYIKRIAIQGFKTYKNTTLVDNISPHHNVVIGSNGSGKSNFFAAIRFVLSDDYNNLRRDERVALIHQGTGSVMSAYVEIVFDNSDKRLHLNETNSTFYSQSQYNQDEVVIRRTIGLKKDEYSVNGKSKTKQEIKSLLESAGFSTSNPYYIVPQGRITALTNAKDYERLQLLKEVTGANVFEKKLKDSLKNMEETNSKREKINNELKELNSKLQDLSEEKEQLVQCQSFEKHKKVLEYTLYDRELNDIIIEINKFQSNYQENINQSSEYVEELEKRENLVREILEKTKTIDNSLQIKESVELNHLKESKLELETEIAELTVTKEDLLHCLEAEQSNIETQLHLLQDLESKIESNNMNIDKIKPEYDMLIEKENALKIQTDALLQRQRYLISKKGKYANFHTKEDRDEWIQEDITNLQKSLENFQHEIKESKEETAELNGKLESLDEQISDVQDSIDGPEVSANLLAIEQSLNTLKSEYYEEIDERKQHWREEQTLKTVLDSLTVDIEQAERNLNETMNRNLSSGLNAIKNISKRLNLGDDNIYGTLGELLQYNEKYKTCVEVIGGNALFHVVVDNENTATLLMNELHKDKLGRITFMPLNKLNLSDQVEYPSTEENCIPLIKKLHFDAKFANAVKLIFGKTIVVKELNTGVRLAKHYKLTSITPDGDRVDQRGVLSGGFNDFYNKTTRLDCLKSLKQKRNEYMINEKRLTELKITLDQSDKKIEEINTKIKDISYQKESLVHDIDTHKNKANQLKSEKYGIEEQIKLIHSKSVTLENSVVSITNRVQNLQEDLQQSFNTELSSEETAELQEITKMLPQLEAKQTALEETLSSITLELESLKSENKSKLQPQYSLLKHSGSDEAKILNLQSEIQVVKSKLSTIEKKDQEVSANLNDLKTEINQMKAERANHEKLLSKANSQQRLLLKKIDEYQKDSERAMIKKSNLTSRKNELQTRITELGFLPEDAFSKYKNESSEKLVQELTKTTKKLSKYTNVNKRAGESFSRFMDKKQDLQEKAKDLDLSKKSIEDLIATLKDQKVNAIETTFEKVSLYFTEMFERLAPRGTGRLIIHKKTSTPEVSSTTRKNKKRKTADSEFSDDENDQDDQSAAEVDNLYDGVSIAVSFNSKNDERLHVEQLSGGQKTVCAIALILAIQKVDPAPFYLFDEVDAALDKQYRTSVAATIKELSANAQFICTTFRTDMINRADRFYRVKFENKLSTVVEVNRDDAIRFIKGDSKNAMAEV